MALAEIDRKLLVSRNELLDIGLRNNLLNFRKTAKSLLAIDECSEEVFRQLFVQNKAMFFAALPDKARAARGGQDADAEDGGYEFDAAALDTLFDDETDEARSRRHTDNRLQTALSSTSLLSRLLKIESEARTYIEEQGVNVLYLALGFLHWYEAGSSQEARLAPLVLLPVELARTEQGKTEFALRYNGDDLIDNMSLSAKMKTDFGLQIPPYVQDPDAENNEQRSLADYFSQLTESVSAQARWRVEPDEIALGFFSFGKFLMFNDLDSKNWPEGKKPAAHPVMARLLGEGFGMVPPAIGDAQHLDSIIKPGDISFVKDADSSQTEAILEANAGHNLVIQGPPGTGKSQTITNIISQLLKQSKTVLFVAEKMAALEVVKSRLDECHLGDAVLELHSHKATKKSVLTELERSLSQGRPQVVSGQDDLATLAEVQNSLNTYCNAVNESDPVSGLPFIQVVGHYMRLKRAADVPALLAFEPMSAWSQNTYLEKRILVDELFRHLLVMGTPQKSPYWGSNRRDFSPVEQSKASESLELALVTLRALDAAAASLSVRLMLTRPATILDIEVVCRAARRAAEAPRLQGVCLSTKDWQLRRDTISELLDAGEQMSSARAQSEAMLIENAWEQDLLEVRQHLASYGQKWWRIFSGKFRSARSRLQGLCKSPLPKENDSAIRLVDSVLAYQSGKKIYDQDEALGAALFGAQWNRQRSDWQVLRHISGWVMKLHDDLGRGELPAGLVDFLSGHSDASGLGEEISRIELQLRQLGGAQNDAAVSLGFDSKYAAVLGLQSLREAEETLQTLLSDLPKVYHMARFNQLSEELHSAGLGDLVQLGSRLELPEQLLVCFDLSWYSGLVERAYARHPALRQFDRVRHEHQIQRFRQLDVTSLDHAKSELARVIWERMPHINQPGEMAVLRAELNKKRRHIPIRQLIDRAGRAIQQIKPVFMMSPISIANFLPPGAIEFDTVIFDEASQVKAVDAFGAILRGKQVIVVGDTKQMPPTSFFGRDVDLEDEDSVTADVESILSMFKLAGAQERYLRWHYRSRHESLIAVSNVEFYERKLMVFPSPGRNPHATGLSLKYLPETLYDRGRTRTNRGEARAVALAVIEHAKTRPGLSLGAVAFSVAQRDAIQMELELLRRQHPELEQFFNLQKPEPFFVKNLENVQGDERDIIFISVGYGRNESGRIAKDFGPVSRDGGHRRLNVLITRAKLGMTVFSNFCAGDLELDASASHGSRALKHFLKYAETGELDLPRETGKAPDSVFEREVIEALEDKGYQVEPQVGSAGYFIDIGVKDPDAPGSYLLAIECDGAAYHSSRSARDRDRLRQGVLEGLGWRFHRVWSTDWFRNPQQELERILLAIENAKASSVAPAMVTPARPANVVIDRDTSLQKMEANGGTVPAYCKAVLPSRPGSLTEVGVASLVSLIRAVLEIETPIHQEELGRRLMEAYGVKRMGTRIEAAIDAAVVAGVASHEFYRAGHFLYLDKERHVTLRSREGLAPSEKKIEFVAPEELDLALKEIIRAGFSLAPDEAISGALALLGFGRATSKISEAVQQRLQSLQQTGQVQLVQGRLRPADWSVPLPVDTNLRWIITTKE